MGCVGGSGSLLRIILCNSGFHMCVPLPLVRPIPSAVGPPTPKNNRTGYRTTPRFLQGSVHAKAKGSLVSKIKMMGNNGGEMGGKGGNDGK